MWKKWIQIAVLARFVSLLIRFYATIVASSATPSFFFCFLLFFPFLFFSPLSLHVNAMSITALDVPF